MSETTKKGNHYVDKKVLYDSFVSWYAAIDAAEREGRERPEPPRYILESVIKICENYSRKFNFYQYSFREDMVGDAIANIIKYLDRFDLSNPKQNPFQYISKSAFRSFIRRISIEEHQSLVKHRVIMNSGILDAIVTQESDDPSDFSASALEILQSNLNPELEEKYHRRLAEKRSQRLKPDGDEDIEDLISSFDEEFVCEE
jgi:hypothetical protein